MNNSICVLFFRNDLRVHDQPLFEKVLKLKPKYVLPVYCLNQIETQTTYIGNFPKIESLNDLNQHLKGLNNQLYITKQSPQLFLKNLLQLQNEQNFHILIQKEISPEETKTEFELKKLISKHPSTSIDFTWGLTLFHLHDLPFDPKRETPSTFTEFRKRVEAQCSVRSLIPTPDSLPPFPLELMNLFDERFPLHKFQMPDFQVKNDIRRFNLKGGETEGKKRLNDYLPYIKDYKNTRNGLLHLNDSSKFSPYLSNGSLSPRLIFWEILKSKNAEEWTEMSEGPYWLIFELLWRDYFKCVGLQFPNELFHQYGISQKEIEWKQPKEKELKAFMNGQTGIPFIDAAMRELLLTGWMSNRMRQNVGSFWTKSLGFDWRYMACWFESQLIDYDVQSNYGNWLYVAGIGNDPRENRKFNVMKQAFDYDPQGLYIKKWVTELEKAEGKVVFAPWKFSTTYYKPMIIEREWEKYLSADLNGKKEPRRSDWKVKRFPKNKK